MLGTSRHKYLRGRLPRSTLFFRRPHFMCTQCTLCEKDHPHNQSSLPNQGHQSFRKGCPGPYHYGGWLQGTDRKAPLPVTLELEDRIHAVQHSHPFLVASPTRENAAFFSLVDFSQSSLLGNRCATACRPTYVRSTPRFDNSSSSTSSTYKVASP